MCIVFLDKGDSGGIGCGYEAIGTDAARNLQ